MVLSDRDIIECLNSEELVIDPVNYDNIGCSSVDLTLDNIFKFFPEDSFIDIKKPYKAEMKKRDSLLLNPGKFILGQTVERVKIPNNMIARVEGRSSFGRLGIMVHITAGFIDAGFEGNITLEIKNVNSVPIRIYSGVRICQLAFEKMTSEAQVPYSEKPNQKYNKQELPQQSKIFNDFR